MRTALKTMFQFSEKCSIHPASTAPAAPQFLQAMPASYGGASSSGNNHEAQPSAARSSTPPPENAAQDTLRETVESTSRDQNLLKENDADEEFTITDVPVDGPPDEIALDETILIRRMSRKALMLEATSKNHLIAHHFHNPFCNICIRAHMKQRRYAKKTEAEGDGLTNVTEPLKQLGTDTMIIAKAANDERRSSASNNISIHTIRDEYSGMSYAVPQQTRSVDENY